MTTRKMGVNKMSKKRIVKISLIAILVVLILLSIPFFKTIFQVPIIGSITGAEYEFIEIDGVRYVKDSSGARAGDFSGADRGEYLGAVTDGNITMRVFSVKGDDSRRYIYALWDWDGAFYSKEDNQQI